MGVTTVPMTNADAACNRADEPDVALRHGDNKCGDRECGKNAEHAAAGSSWRARKYPGLTITGYSNMPRPAATTAFAAAPAASQAAPEAISSPAVTDSPAR
jgi:hypothetical protein